MDRPYVRLDRAEWAKRRAAMPLPLEASELERIRGLGDEIDLDEVVEVYLPLSRLLSLRVAATEDLRAATAHFLGTAARRAPYVIGVAGSVAVGKSTTARLLQVLLARWPVHPKVDLVTTDGFLHPNAELERRGLMQRKGFPESYDRRALLQFLARVKSGVAEVTAPVYDHLTYDIVAGEHIVVRRPDILLLEGLNVLQPPRPDREGHYGPAVSDFFDFSLYVDADPVHIRRWYIERFLRLRETAFSDRRSYFRRYADLDDAGAAGTAEQIWDSVNGPNLTLNIAPTRDRASLVLVKAADHSVQTVWLRDL